MLVCLALAGVRAVKGVGIDLRRDARSSVEGVAIGDRHLEIELHGRGVPRPRLARPGSPQRNPEHTRLAAGIEDPLAACPGGRARSRGERGRVRAGRHSQREEGSRDSEQLWREWLHEAPHWPAGPSDDGLDGDRTWTRRGHTLAAALLCACLGQAYVTAGGAQRSKCGTTPRPAFPLRRW